MTGKQNNASTDLAAVQRPAQDIRQDPGLHKLLSRMPEDVAASFTEQQLSQLRLALGARQWRKHQVDIRGTLTFWRWRYYYVLVAGRNLRDGVRSGQKISQLMLAVMISLLLVLCSLCGLLLLYLLKSALGIDLFDGYSLGIWHWFRGLFQG